MVIQWLYIIQWLFNGYSVACQYMQWYFNYFLSGMLSNYGFIGVSNAILNFTYFNLICYFAYTMYLI